MANNFEKIKNHPHRTSIYSLKKGKNNGKEYLASKWGSVNFILHYKDKYGKWRFTFRDIIGLEKEFTTEKPTL